MKKTALITGASSGIGYGLAKIFAKNNYSLVLVSENKQELEDAAKEIDNQCDLQVKAIIKDLSKPSAAQELYDGIIARAEISDTKIANVPFGNE